MNNKQTILAITGSDGTGGSGIQADIRCICELGGTVTSVVTSITVQNTLGIQEFYDLPAAIVRKQIEAIFNDLQPQIVKIGLIRRIDVVLPTCRRPFVCTAKPTSCRQHWLIISVVAKTPTKPCSMRALI